jgi:rhodanese-related sulfurtransferase
MTQTITRDEIKTLLDNGAPITIVEALPEKYFKHSHLPGAINIPHNQVGALAPAMLPNKEALIVVYCANTACQNSAIAARELSAMGYSDVREYVEGKQDWVDAGLPVETRRSAA